MSPTSSSKKVNLKLMPNRKYGSVIPFLHSSRPTLRKEIMFYNIYPINIASNTKKCPTFDHHPRHNKTAWVSSGRASLRHRIIPHLIPNPQAVITDELMKYLCARLRA
ncbi:unnamed protein product [Lepeophtheirus salmonis]|uniref:(salmon louse) hypothetical protein n=1 Tax=Lepeophtheirus salmonis TaxID=72036 RepID=A0A7R8CEG5_LEPSM|nr:unnamed protein product [Lepeophtheirus salmonis]CAF2795948.1 unnamed protein product [Lepeophtheirus salmonis]